MRLPFNSLQRNLDALITFIDFYSWEWLIQMFGKWSIVVSAFFSAQQARIENYTWVRRITIPLTPTHQYSGCAKYVIFVTWHLPTGAGFSWASLSWGRCFPWSASSPFPPPLDCNPEWEVLLEVRLPALAVAAPARRFWAFCATKLIIECNGNWVGVTTSH